MGNMVTLNSVYSKTDRIKKDYLSIVGIDDHEDGYICIEHYCDNPNCRCQNVLCKFYKIYHKENKLTHICDLLFDLNKPTHVIIDNDYGNSELANILKKELGDALGNPDYLDQVKHEYRLLKVKVAEKMETVPALKIGRNEACYCGSGKKHKKCCMIKI